jgi:hypothetical protein
MLQELVWSNEMKITNPDMETTIQRKAPLTATQDQQTEPQRPLSPVLSPKTPQEFYAEITKRADVRAIMEELATG